MGVTKAPKSKNLIPVPRAVERAGKTFTQTYWVKAEDVGLEAAGYDPKQPGSSASVAAFRAVVDKLAGPGAGSLAESYTTSWTGSCQDAEGARVMGTVAALLGMDREKVAKLPFITHTAHGQDLLKQYDAAMADSNNPLRKALMATYAVTQAALKDEPDTIRLMRGSKKDGPALLAAAKALADKGVRYDEAALTMELNTLNCFTSKNSVANDFAGTAGVVYSIDVPKSAVLFSYKSTPGHSTSYGINGSDEKEYTVMCQGPTAVSVRNISGKVGQEIYNYFAARGLTGDAAAKEAPPPGLPPDPNVSFKISTKSAEQLAALKELAKQVGGEASAQGGVVLPASKMDAFIEGFEKSPAYDPSVKPIDKVKAWLSGKAASAVAEAKLLADKAVSLKAGLEAPQMSWRADEPESKASAAAVRAAVEKAQADLEASGKADTGSPGAAAPPKAPGVEAKVTQKPAGDDEEAAAAHDVHASAMEHMESKGFGALAKSILGAEVGAGGKVKLAEPEKVQAHEAGVSAAEDAMKEAHEVATKAMSFALGKGSATPAEAPQKKKADAMGYQPADVEAAKAPGSSAVAGVPSKAYPGHTGPALEMKPSDTPQSWNVKHVNEAKGIGGAGEKHFYESSSGKKWLVKVAAAKKGGEEQPYKAEAQVFASKVAQLVKPGSVEVGHASHGGKAATIQPWLDVKGTLGGKPPESLSESQKADVASEHVLDWLTSQHDSHGKNLVIKPDGKVVGIDKEQAFKHIGKDKLDVDYHPNSAFGEEEPYYNKFWRSFAEGTMDFDPKAMKDAIDRVKQIPTSHYVEQLKPYVESLHPNDKAAQNKLLTAAVQRKENLQKDFEQFIGKHFEKREGAKGTFTFEGGWQKEGSKPSAPKAEAGGPAPSPKAEAQAHAGGDVEKLPDVPEEDLKAFFAAKAGEQPPHRKWYWKKWAEAAMNKAKVPKEEQPEVWKKVLAQGKVMVAKKTLAGQKVSQAQHEAYIKAQAAKKGATPEMMPVVQEKPKAEKPAAAPAAPKPQKAPPEHPYQYYWKTWANAAAKEATGKGAPSHVHDKISGLAKKFVAEKQAAGAKFTGKDLEKFIKAAAKKGGDHPGEI